MKKTALSNRSLLCLSALAVAQNAALGAGGIELTAVENNSSSAYSILLQPDGGIVAGGRMFFTDPSSGLQYDDFAAVRYLTNGALDTSFNGTGQQATAMNVDPSTGDSGGSVAYGSYLQSDGRIVLAGVSAPAYLSDNVALVRYNSDGSLDTTFNGTGTVYTPVDSSSAAYAIEGQPWDGKLVVAGSANAGGPDRILVVRYNTDGSLDTTFGTGGIVRTSINQYASVANALAIYPGSKLVVGGQTWNGTKYNMSLVRYNSDGSLDTTFGSGGKVTTQVGTKNDVIEGIAVQSDGKIVAVGHTDTVVNKKTGQTAHKIAVVRYTATGALDATFGSSGVKFIDLGGNDDAGGIAIQSDGKIVIGGYSNSLLTSSGVAAVLRLNPSGSLDGTFGTSGVVKQTVLQYASAVSLAIQTDGKIVAGGNANNATGNRFLVMRLNPNGSLDTGF